MGRGQYPRIKGSRASWHKDAMKMFNAGRSQADIAAKHGVSRERVRQVLVSYGGHESRVSPEIMKEKILSLYGSDKCIDEIAKRLNKPFNYITKVIRRAGVSIDPARRYAKHFNIINRAIHDRESTVSGISKDSGISSGVVFFVLQKHLNKEAFQKILDRAKVSNRKELHHA